MPERFNGQTWFMTKHALESFLSNYDSVKSSEMGENYGYEVVDSISVIEVKGVLEKKKYWYSDSSYQEIEEKIEASIEDPEVKAICLKVESPGGNGNGLKELADYIFHASKSINIYAYADGIMCSAAYWLSSSAKEIAAPLMASVGSIGVRSTHVDRSKAYESHGLKITNIIAGSYKDVGTDIRPMNKKDTETMQHSVDVAYSIFLNDVARNRGVSPEKTLEMADGKVFFGQEALDIGLIDRIEESFSTFLTYIKKKEKIEPMKLNEFKEKHLDLYNEVVGIGSASASSADADRVLKLASAIVGEEKAASLKALVETGMTAEQFNAFSAAMGKPVAIPVTKQETTPKTVTTPVPETEATATTDQESRKQILEGIQGAHADGLAPDTVVKTEPEDIEAQADKLLEGLF